MKQQTHDKFNVWRTRKKSEPQMGYEPTTLRDPIWGSDFFRVLQTFNLSCVPLKMLIYYNGQSSN